MSFEDIYKKRRSNRFLKSDPIPEELVNKLIEAGSYAPVAKGRYGDQKLYVVEGEKLKSLQKILAEERGDSTYGSGLLILFLSREANSELANQNAGCVLENICLEAADLGLGSTFLYSTAQQIKHSEKALALLKIEEGWDVIAGVTIGYKASEEVRDIDHKFEVIR